jgi:hypothetical protein
MATQYSDNIAKPEPRVFGTATSFVIRRIGLADLSDALRLDRRRGRYLHCNLRPCSGCKHP